MVVADTGDTAWTEALVEVSSDADLVIAEAHSSDRQVPFHLLHRDLLEHRARRSAAWIVHTHMGAEVLALVGRSRFEAAHDGPEVER